MTSPNLASGMTSRFSALWRRDIVRLRRISINCSRAANSNRPSTRNIGFSSSLRSIRNPRLKTHFGRLAPYLERRCLRFLTPCVSSTPRRYMIANAGQILHPAAADHDHGMLLQIMSLARDIANYLETIGQADLGDFAQSRIRLFRRCRVDPRADAPLLRAGAEMARLFAIGLFLPRLADQLTDRGHPWSFCNLSELANTPLRQAPVRRQDQTFGLAANAWQSANMANDKAPSARQGFRRLDWQRTTASDAAFLPLNDPGDFANLWTRNRLDRCVTVKPLGPTAFRFEKSGTGRPGSKNLLPVRSGRNLMRALWRVNPLSQEKRC